MSLVGRLEDLPLSDILQIIYLSRRSGRLQIRNDSGEHTILFRNGLIAGISSSEQADLATYLLSLGAISEHSLHLLQEAERAGIPPGTAILEWNLLSSDALSRLIEERIAALLSPLIASKEGQFNFVLNDKVTHQQVGYETELLVGMEGFAPERFLGTDNKLNPLRGLEDSAGARSSSSGRGADGAAGGQRLSTGDLGSLMRPPSDRPLDRTVTRFAVDSSTASTLHSAAVAEKVVLFEPEPRLRVALKRTFAARGIEVLQFHATQEARQTVGELLAAQSFFITVLDGSEAGARGVEISRFLRMIKEVNRFLPVAVVHGSEEGEMPERILEPEVELRLMSPMRRAGEPRSEDSVEQFVEEVVEFVEEALTDWKSFVGQQDDTLNAERELYRIAENESHDRRTTLLENLIGAVSDNSDLESVAMTLLRVGAEYVDRGVLFVPEDDSLVAIAGFGTTGSGEEMYRRIKGARFSRSEASVLAEVFAGRSHFGKLRRTPANESLISTMGQAQPTEVVVIPLKNEGRVIGLFYGDNAEHHAMIGNARGLEVFFANAGRALESALAQGRS